MSDAEHRYLVGYFAVENIIFPVKEMVFCPGLGYLDTSMGYHDVEKKFAVQKKKISVGLRRPSARYLKVNWPDSEH